MAEGDQSLIQQSSGDGQQQAQQVGGDQEGGRQSGTNADSQPRPRHVTAVILTASVLAVVLIVLGIAGVLAWTVVVPCCAALVALSGFVAKNR